MLIPWIIFFLLKIELSDNGTIFQSLKKKKLCKKYSVQLHYKKKDYLYKYNISFISFCFNGLFINRMKISLRYSE